MAFTRARTPGAWTVGTPVLSSEFDHFDDYYKAIDGAGGGTYAPSTEIVIGGSGLRMTALSHVDGTTLDVTNVGSLEIDGGSTLRLDLGSTTNVHGTFKFFNDSTGSIESGATFTVKSGAELLVASGGLLAVASGGELDISGGATLKITAGGSLNVYGSETLESGATLTLASGSTTNVNSGASFFVLSGAQLTVNNGGTLYLSPTSTLAAHGAIVMDGILTLTGAGRIQKRVYTGHDADHAYSAANGDEIRTPTLTADRIYTLTSTGAAEGDVVEIINTNSGFTITIKNDVGTVIHAGLPLKKAGGSDWKNRFVFTSGAWTLDGHEVW